MITLTTDFGLADTYVGVMKGVILGIAPNVQLVDLTHDIAPQNVAEAAVRLEAAVPFFPAGTVHLVIVDPGVGSERAALIVRAGGQTYVAPDNGVLSEVLRGASAVEAVQVTEAAQPYLLHPVSATFHGRDLFAPVAAHLAAGIAPAAFGRPISSGDLVTLPGLDVDISSWHGAIIPVPILYVDRFGNLITAFRRSDWNSLLPAAYGASAIEFRAGPLAWHGIVDTYAAVAAGEPLAYWGSGGRLEIAVRNGSAAAATGLRAGDTIAVT